MTPLPGAAAGTCKRPSLRKGTARFRAGGEFILRDTDSTVKRLRDDEYRRNGQTGGVTLTTLRTNEQADGRDGL